MISRKDVLSLNFIKKSPFTGSHKGMRFRLSKEATATGDGQESGTQENLLCVIVWPEPYSFSATEEEEKEQKEFPFSEEGIVSAVNWLNEKWESEIERFCEAKSKW